MAEGAAPTLTSQFDGNIANTAIQNLPGGFLGQTVNLPTIDPGLVGSELAAMHAIGPQIAADLGPALQEMRSDFNGQESRLNHSLALEIQDAMNEADTLNNNDAQYEEDTTDNFIENEEIKNKVQEERDAIVAEEAEAQVDARALEKEKRDFADAARTMLAGRMKAVLKTKQDRETVVLETLRDMEESAMETQANFQKEVGDRTQKMGVLSHSFQSDFLERMGGEYEPKSNDSLKELSELRNFSILQESRAENLVRELLYGNASWSQAWTPGSDALGWSPSLEEGLVYGLNLSDEYTAESEKQLGEF